MQSLPLSTTNIYMIIYGIIFILFIVAFASQPYLTVSNDAVNMKFYYTNITSSGFIGNTATNGTVISVPSEKLMIINDSGNDFYVILILSIIIFICFGCSFLTLYLNSKKLNKFFNIIMLLSMIIIIITFHVSIYAINSKIRNFINKSVTYENGEYLNTTIKTTETAGYGLTMTCTVLLFITVVSSFFYN